MFCWQTFLLDSLVERKLIFLLCEFISVLLVDFYALTGSFCGSLLSVGCFICGKFWGKMSTCSCNFFRYFQLIFIKVWTKYCFLLIEIAQTPTYFTDKSKKTNVFQTTRFWLIFDVSQTKLVYDQAYKHHNIFGYRDICIHIWLSFLLFICTC